MISRFALGLSFLLTACGSSTVSHDAASTLDAGIDAVALAEADGGTDTDPVHGCAEADFIDLRSEAAEDRMVTVPVGGSSFDPPCVTISLGQAVMFMWDFSLHPLAPGVAPGHEGAGTEPSPIAAQTSGEDYEVSFPTAGSYPFYCTTHYHAGMYGVVRVAP